MTTTTTTTTNNTHYFVLSDVHIGKKTPDNNLSHKNSLSYLLDEAVKLKAKNSIKEFVCVICGDLFDARVKIGSEDLIYAFNFLKRINTIFDKIYLVVGNHDMYNNISGHDCILDIFENDKTIVVRNYLSNSDGVFIPYNDEKLLNCVTNSDKLLANHKLCFCHQAVKMIAPSMAEGSIDPSIFSDFKLVVAGHIHVRKTYKNIVSIGCPTSFSFADDGITNFGGLYIDNKYNYKFIDSPHYLIYKTLHIENEGDIENITNIKNKEKHCLRLIVNPEIQFQVYDVLKDEDVNKFTSVRTEINVVMPSDDELENTNGKVKIQPTTALESIRNEFESETTRKVFDNIVTDIITNFDDDDIF